jgi:lysophospholipase L1-like esterase
VHATDFACRSIKPLAARVLFAAMAMIATVVMPPLARADDAKPPCNPALDQVRLNAPLKRVAQKIALGEPVTIVAIGSSSTAGAGATSQLHSYPSQLGLDLRQRFPKQSFTVINRGVNGEEVLEMLKRFDTAVIANKPDLLLWQLGTNSLIRDHALGDGGASIRAGLNKVRAIGADVVLIDPQFAPKVIARPDAEAMVRLIGLTAKAENVDLFPRYQVMRQWREGDKIGFETFVSPDGLHLNDWGYACMAKGLGMAIAEAATRQIISAKATAPARPMVSLSP